MHRIFRAVKTPLLCLLCLGIAVAACLYPGFGREKEEEKGGTEILRVWQIDSFEGGRGSRASFLNGVARLYEKEGAAACTFSSS